MGLAPAEALGSEPPPDRDAPPQLEQLAVEASSSDLLLVSTVAVVISFLATVYPAWSAARLDPVEGLRYE